MARQCIMTVCHNCFIRRPFLVFVVPISRLYLPAKHPVSNGTKIWKEKYSIVKLTYTSTSSVSETLLRGMQNSKHIPGYKTDEKKAHVLVQCCVAILKLRATETRATWRSATNGFLEHMHVLAKWNIVFCLCYSYLCYLTINCVASSRSNTLSSRSIPRRYLYGADAQWNLKELQAPRST